MRPARFIPPVKTVSQWRAGLAIDCSKPRSRHGRICRREVASRNPKRPGRCMRLQRFAQGQHKRHACPARMPRIRVRHMCRMPRLPARVSIIGHPGRHANILSSDDQLVRRIFGCSSRSRKTWNCIGAEAFVKRNPRCYSGHKPSEVRHAYPQTEFGFRLLRSRNCSMVLHAGCGTRGNRNEARSRRVRNA